MAGGVVTALVPVSLAGGLPMLAPGEGADGSLATLASNDAAAAGSLAVTTGEDAVDVLPTIVPGRSPPGCWCLPQAALVAVVAVGFILAERTTDLSTILPSKVTMR